MALVGKNAASNVKLDWSVVLRIEGPRGGATFRLTDTHSARATIS